jgi:hypothetical protein
VFDLRIPSSLASLPGRLHVCEDDPVQAPKTHAERLSQMKAYNARRGTLAAREADRKYYESNREAILVRRKELRLIRLQDPEYRAKTAAKQKAYKESHREQMAANQRAYYQRKRSGL